MVSVLRIFSQFSRVEKYAENYYTENLFPICTKVILDEKKFSRESKIVSLSVIDRACSHKTNNLNIEILKEVIETGKIKILEYLFGIFDPYDLE